MIRFINDIDDIRPAQLTGFFVAWPDPPSPEEHLKILQNSDHVVLAISEENQVVGFVNALTDGVLSAYIPLMEVVPEYQHLGIGKKLMERMFVHLKDYYMVDLCCDEELTTFYAGLGMQKVSGMVLRKPGQQKEA